MYLEKSEDMEDLFQYDDEFSYGIKLRRFPGSHLSAPLTYYPQKLLIKYFEENTGAPTFSLKKGLELLSFLNETYPGIRFTYDPASVYYSLLSASYSLATDMLSQAKSDLRDIIQSSLLDLEVCYSAVRHHHPGLVGLKLKSTPLVLDGLGSKNAACYSLMMHMIQVKSDIQRSTLDDSWPIKGPYSLGDLIIHSRNELIVARYTSGGENLGVVMNYEQWIMLCDTFASRFLSILTCDINDQYKIDTLPTKELLIRVYKWGDEMIGECRMHAYALIGEFESMVTSALVSFADADILNLGSNFNDSIIENARDIQTEYNVPLYWTTRLLDILRGVTSVNILSELFGLRKHWGIPIVDAAASGRAVQEKLDEDLPIKATALIDLHASFNRMIAISYMKKHHTWPKCEMLQLDYDYPLFLAWKRNTTRLPERNPQHQHAHWANLRFHCNCVTDTYADQLSLLSDKSVSVPVSDLDSIYIRGLRSGDQKEFTVSSSERRLILEFLKKDHYSVMDILKMIMRNEIPPDWLANSAAMKGTEMKYWKARIFAVLTFEIRQYFAVTEDMIKNHLFPYNPHQTMTMSETELLKTLREVTRQLDIDSVSRTLNVMHIIDFSKWNLRMRYENTCLVFKSIDDFLGYPGLIERSHPIFASMVNLVQDAFNPPKESVSETESDTIWRIHTRGWEGQRQKGWTLLTSSLLSDLERVTGISSKILGQGDNQTLLAQFPIPAQYRNSRDWITHSPDDIRSQLDQFYEQLESTCNAVGLKVKTAESCRSLHYLNYGKRLYFNGAELSMTLKRVSKAMTESNDAFPTTENRLKTSQGASYAAGLYSNPSPWPYVMSRVCTFLILWESFTANPLLGDLGKKSIEKVMTFSPRVISYMMKIPASLGGPSQQPFPSFLCRGHPDPLCEDLSILTLKARYGCHISRAILQCADDGIWFSERKDDKSTLIMSPFSLNLKTPPSAKLPIAKAVLPALTNFCRNASVIPMLTSDMNEYGAMLIKILSTLSPFNPIVANDIYARSVEGQRQSFVMGLKNSTSLCRLVQDSNHNPIVNQIMQLEMEQMEFWISCVQDISRRIYKSKKEIPPHHELAQKYREQSWGTELTGVTVPHPIELFTMVKSHDDLCSSHNTGMEDEHILLVRHSDNLTYPSGSDRSRLQLIRSQTGKPYLGSRISEGMVSKQIVCKTPSKAWLDACRLNVIRQWISAPGSDLDSLMLKVIAGRTDASYSLLSMATGRPSRLSYSHRAALMATRKTCSITTTSNMMTRIYASSNRMGQYSSGDLNYHLAFGPAFITMSALVCLDGVMDSIRGWVETHNEIYHCHLWKSSVPVVYDETMNVSVTSDDLVVPSNLPQMLYCQSSKLIFEENTGNPFTRAMYDIAQASMLDSKVGYAHVLLGDLFVREVSSRELSAAEILPYYNRRDSPISIGDIKLTGVIGLVRSISVNSLLSIPIHMIYQSSEEGFMCYGKNFLDNFSQGFWDFVTTPMIHMSVLSKLFKIAGLVSSSYRSSSVRSAVDTFKLAVVKDMYSLSLGLAKGVRLGSKSPFNLYIPNMNAARYLYSRYVEVCAWIYFREARMPLSKAGIYARKIARAAFVDQEAKTEFMVHLKVQYNTICTKHPADFGVTEIPSIKFFNISDPWIDKVRSYEFESKDKITSYISGKSECGLKPQAVAIFNLGLEEIKSVVFPCECKLDDNGLRLETEFFFGRNSIRTIDPILSWEAICHHDLSHQHVVIIGDKEGDIGYELCSHDKTDSVYIAGCKDTTDYDPHLIGSFVPTSFVGTTLQEKLFSASSAAVIGSPMKSNTSRRRMISQLRSREWNGLILSVDWSKDTVAIHNLENLRGTIYDTVTSLISVKWVICVLRATCLHQAQLMTSDIGCLFRNVNCYRPVVVPQGSNVYVVVGWSRQILTHKFDPALVLANVLNPIRWEQFVVTRSMSNIPYLARVSPEVQKSWCKLYSDKQDNLKAVCDAYISGWGSSYKVSLSRDEMVRDLRKAQIILEQVLSSSHHVRAEVEASKSIVRRDIMSVSALGFSHQIVELLDRWVRCGLLRQILMASTARIADALRIAEEMLSKIHVISIAGVSVEHEVQYSSFCSQYSKHLFSILGHVWYTALDTDVAPISQLIHYSYTQSLVPEPFRLPILLTLNSSNTLGAELKYVWLSRAKTLFVLMSCLHSDSTILADRSLCLTVKRLLNVYPTLEGQVSYIHEGGPYNHYMIWNADLKNVDSRWISDISALLMSYKLLMVVPTALVSEIHSFFHISHLVRVPWTGIVPVVVCLQLSGVRPTKIDLAVHVDFSLTVNKIFTAETKTGCKCYDCATEAAVLKTFGLDSYLLEQICNPNLKESIRDVHHFY